VIIRVLTWLLVAVILDFLDKTIFTRQGQGDLDSIVKHYTGSNVIHT